MFSIRGRGVSISSSHQSLIDAHADPLQKKPARLLTVPRSKQHGLLPENSIRCNKCGQLKKAEEELSKAQETMEKQALDVHRAKAVIDVGNSRVNSANSTVMNTVRDLNKISGDMSRQAGDVVKLRKALMSFRSLLPAEKIPLVDSLLEETEPF